MYDKTFRVVSFDKVAGHEPGKPRKLNGPFSIYKAYIRMCGIL